MRPLPETAHARSPRRRMRRRYGTPHAACRRTAHVRCGSYADEIALSGTPSDPARAVWFGEVGLVLLALAADLDGDEDDDDVDDQADAEEGGEQPDVLGGGRAGEQGSHRGSSLAAQSVPVSRPRAARRGPATRPEAGARFEVGSNATAA